MIAFALGVVFFVTLQLGNTAPAFHFPLLIEALALACATVLVWKSTPGLFRSQLSRTSRLFFMTLGCLVALYLLRSVFALGEISESPVCGLMPGVVQKIECSLQMEAASIPGVRQLSYVIAASTLFAASAVSGLMMPAMIRHFLSGGLLLSALLASITLLKYYGLIDWALPHWFFVNEIGPACLFMQNSSWIWPWCTPWIAFALWQAASTQRPRALRILNLICALLLTLYSVSSSQRGAVFQLIAAGAVGFVTFLLLGNWRKRVSKVTSKIMLGLGSACAGGLVWVYFSAPTAIHQIVSNLGLRTKVGSGASSLSHERLKMWHIAWSGIQDNLWTGHGQGSWTREFGKLAHSAGRAELTLDTAHSFFVQSIFELGLLHSLLILGFFTYLIITIGKVIFCTAETIKKCWFVALCGAYGVILLVQEVDFIRSSYYQHAIFWGFLFGQTRCHVIESASPTQTKSNTAATKRKLWIFRNALFGILVGSAGLMILALFGFSLAGFQYEANARNGYIPKVRWLGSFGTLNYVLPRADQKHPVARFRVLKSFATEYSILTIRGWKKVSIANPDSAASYIDIPVSSGFHLPKVVKFNNAQNDYGRHISVLVAWPPEIIEGQQ